jgi:hypothetical protein
VTLKANQDTKEPRYLALKVLPSSVKAPGDWKWKVDPEGRYHVFATEKGVRALCPFASTTGALGAFSPGSFAPTWIPVCEACKEAIENYVAALPSSEDWLWRNSGLAFHAFRQFTVAEKSRSACKQLRWPEGLLVLKAGDSLNSGDKVCLECVSLVEASELVKDVPFDYLPESLRLCIVENSVGFKPGDVASVELSCLGEAGKADWHWILRLHSGTWVYLHGGCDAAGWEVRSCAEVYFASTQEEAIAAAGEVIAPALRDMLKWVGHKKARATSEIKGHDHSAFVEARPRCQGCKDGTCSQAQVGTLHGSVKGALPKVHSNQPDEILRKCLIKTGNFQPEDIASIELTCTGLTDVYNWHWILLHRGGAWLYLTCEVRKSNEGEVSVFPKWRLTLTLDEAVQAAGAVIANAFQDMLKCGDRTRSTEDVLKAAAKPSAPLPVLFHVTTPDGVEYKELALHHLDAVAQLVQGLWVKNPPQKPLMETWQVKTMQGENVLCLATSQVTKLTDTAIEVLLHIREIRVTVKVSR